MNKSSTYKELIQINKKKKVKNGQTTEKEIYIPNIHKEIHSTSLFQRKAN